jgi:hypothetical protein
MYDAWAWVGVSSMGSGTSSQAQYQRKAGKSGDMVRVQRRRGGACETWCQIQFSRNDVFVRNYWEIDRVSHISIDRLGWPPNTLYSAWLTGLLKTTRVSVNLSEMFRYCCPSIFLCKYTYCASKAIAWHRLGLIVADDATFSKAPAYYRMRHIMSTRADYEMEFRYRNVQLWNTTTHSRSVGLVPGETKCSLALLTAVSVSGAADHISSRDWYPRFSYHFCIHSLRLLIRNLYTSTGDISYWIRFIERDVEVDLTTIWGESVRRDIVYDAKTTRSVRN